MLNNSKMIYFKKNINKYHLFLLLLILFSICNISFVAGKTVTGNSITWNFSDPEDVTETSGTMMVINGGAQSPFTKGTFEDYIISINATLENITLEEASKLNTSEWIHYKNQFYRLIPIQEEYIEKINIEINPLHLEGKLTDFDSGDYFSSVKIEIQVNESAIISKYPNNNIILKNLTFNNNGKLTTVQYDYGHHIFSFEDTIILKGNYRLYPFDKYISNIQINDGKLLYYHQPMKSQESGFKLDVYFEKDNIEIIKSRIVLFRYFFSLLFLLISGFVLIKNIQNYKNLELFFGIVGILGFTLYLGFVNINYIESIGFVPYVIFCLIVVYKIYNSNN